MLSIVWEVVLYDVGFCLYSVGFLAAFCYAFYGGYASEPTSGCEINGGWATITVLYHISIVLGCIFVAALLSCEACIGVSFVAKFLIGKKYADGMGRDGSVKVANRVLGQMLAAGGAGTGSYVFSQSHLRPIFHTIFPCTSPDTISDASLTYLCRISYVSFVTACMYVKHA